MAVLSLGRRAFGVLLAAGLSLVASSVAWAQDVPEGLQYEVAEGEVAITGYVGDAVDLVIPGEIEGLPVTSIGEDAFRGSATLESVVLPEGVTEIMNDAFRDCLALTSISLPDSVTYFAGGVFRGCLSLRSIDIPESVTFIESSTFEGCISLRHVVIPEGVEHLGGYNFLKCTSLKTVALSSSVEAIGAYAFSHLAEGSRILVSTQDQYDTLVRFREHYYYYDLTSVVLVPSPEYGMGLWRAFPDVERDALGVGGPDSLWYVADGWLDYVVNEGLMDGYFSNGYFGPYDAITRGQVATILYRAECMEDPFLDRKYGSTLYPAQYATECAFEDMEAGQYYTAAVNWAKDAGVMTGDRATGYTTVRPDDPVSRQELCLMLARYAGDGKVPSVRLDPAKAEGVLDMDKIAAWARNGVYWAVNNDVIGGVDNGDGTFSMDPTGETWRSAAAKMFTVIMRDVLYK